jgi:hypothetical protein
VSRRVCGVPGAGRGGGSEEEDGDESEPFHFDTFIAIETYAINKNTGVAMPSIVIG